MKRSSAKAMPQRTESGKTEYAAVLLVVAMLIIYFSLLILSWPGMQILIKKILGM